VDLLSAALAAANSTDESALLPIAITGGGLVLVTLVSGYVLKQRGKRD